jgi:hypothetical protein
MKAAHSALSGIDACERLPLRSLSPVSIPDALPRYAAARTEGAALARNLKRGAAMSDCDWLVANVDRHGCKIDEVPIADA